MAIQPTFIYKTFDIALELKQTSTNPTFSVIEGDTGNRLHITVTDGGSAVDLTGCRVIAVFSKSNGISMQDNCVANNGITIGGTNNNEVTIDLFSSSLAPGNVECELQIYSGLMEVLITTARFNFTCRRGIMNEDVLLSTNEYPLLIELINIVEGFVDAEDGRVLAEQERVDAESGRAAEMAKWLAANAVANTLPAGSSATATISEADGAKQFTFGIPDGEQGVGIQSITPQGQDESGGNIYTVTLTDNTTYTITAPKGDSVGAANIKDGSTFGSIRSKYSRVEDNSYTIGGYAVALGYNTAASGDKSHAEGEGSRAEGYRSHAEGRDTVTKIYAPNSHAEGWGTIAGSPEQHVQGRYNIEDENSKYAHVVGNGWESGDVVTRSNAHTLSWTGNAWYQGRIKVGGTGWGNATDEVALKSDLEDIGGPNVLNDDGIIKQEHLPSGYPYSEVAEIVPDTEVVIDPNMGDTGEIADQFALVVGGEYTVTWNGTEYACTGQEYLLEGVPCVAVGNVNALNGETPTDEPFVILNFDPDVAAGLGAYGVVFAFDGSASVTVSISGTLITQIDAAYIPDLGGTTNLVNGTMEGTIRSTNSAPEEIGGDYMMGLGAIAMGYLCKASGDYSFAEGVGTEASGTASHAEGTGTASGHYSHTEGYGATASGDYSHAEGQRTTASGDWSHAEGHDTTASGGCSHAEGSNTTASGPQSHAEGHTTIASGDRSHAEGLYTIASGDYSHAEGKNTKASSDYQHVQGQFNIEDSVGKYAHIVGNGIDNSNRSNAHTLDWDGNAWFAGTVKVGGTGWDDEAAVYVLTDPIINTALPASGTALTANTIYNVSAAVGTYAFTAPATGWAHGKFTTGASASVSFAGTFLGAAPAIEASKTYEFDVLDGVWAVQEVVSA